MTPPTHCRPPDHSIHMDTHMPRHHLKARPITTTIRMTSSAFDVHSVDTSRGEDVRIDLSRAEPYEKERLAATLCELHGIGTRKQWQKYGQMLKQEAAERKAKWKARRKAKAAKEATVERKPLHTPMGALA